MKVYSISQWAFYGICILILSLPISRHWKLLLGGNKTDGIVLGYERLIREQLNGDLIIEYASAIQFQADDKNCLAYGPLNTQYEPGRRVKVMYDPADPSANCVLTFSGFYLNNYLVLPLFLITLWGAFYLSFNRYTKRSRKRKIIRKP